MNVVPLECHRTLSLFLLAPHLLYRVQNLSAPHDPAQKKNHEHMHQIHTEECFYQLTWESKRIFSGFRSLRGKKRTSWSQTEFQNTSSWTPLVFPTCRRCWESEGSRLRLQLQLHRTALWALRNTFLSAGGRTAEEKQTQKLEKGLKRV